MTNKFKDILSEITALEKATPFNKETIGWSWAELINAKNDLKSIRLADFIAGLTDYDYLKYQGVDIRLATDNDYQKINKVLAIIYPILSKIELIQLLASKSDIVINIPDGSKIDISYQNPIFNFWGNVYFLIGKNSQVTITDQHLPVKDFSSGSVYLLSGDNSTVEYLSVAGKNSYNFNLHSYPGKFSKHNVYAIGKMTEKYYYYNMTSYLKNDHSENYILASLNFLNNSKSLIRLHNNHIGKKTTGDIKFKGIGWDKSQSKVDGMIEIGKRAYDTNSYLKEDIILASEDSYIKAEPNLEILNNDVKASHGATIGYMDQNALFYLMSRGLSKVKAEKLIADGFLKSLSLNVITKSLKNTFEDYWL